MKKQITSNSPATATPVTPATKWVVLCIGGQGTKQVMGEGNTEAEAWVDIDSPFLYSACDPSVIKRFHLKKNWWAEQVTLRELSDLWADSQGN